MYNKNISLMLYTSPWCGSCRKVKHWLNKHCLSYTEKNVISEKLEKEEIRTILQLAKDSKNSVQKIVSSRCKYIKNNNFDLDSLTIEEIITLIQNKPSILKCPIIIQDNHSRIQIGYREDEIEIFLRYDEGTKTITKIKSDDKYKDFYMQ